MMDTQPTPRPREELPEGYTERPDTFTGIRLAQWIHGGDSLPFWFHYCPACGWVEGLPADVLHDDLIGRQGISRHCRACNAELGFYGFLGAI